MLRLVSVKADILILALKAKLAAVKVCQGLLFKANSRAYSF